MRFIVPAFLLILTGCAELQPQSNRGEELHQYCRQVYSDPRIDPIRDKVAVYAQKVSDISMQMMANQATATDEEKVAILAWAEQRQLCHQRRNELLGQPPAHMEAARGYYSQAMADLYGGQISYGEFAKRGSQIIAAYFQHDQALRAQAQRDAQQQLYQQQQLNLRRQQLLDQNRPVNCTTQYIGNQAYTNCH
jgi:hypothetical protein